MSLCDLVAARAGYRCEYCHAPEVLFNHRFPGDHIIPRIHDGSDDVENLALACHSCNGRKYQKRMGIDIARRKLTRLFNPRQDEWDERFHWNHTKTRITGLTAIGRTTIAALNI